MTMLLNKNTDFELYSQLSQLNEKLLKSETERNILQAKFQHLHEAYRTEENQKITFLKAKYNQFLEDSIKRNQRNERILKSLQKVENGANAVFAKTERLKQLRSHYDAYLSRAMPLWRHPDVLGDTGVSTTWIREPRTAPVTLAYPHPAMLLPGGGAVMLPVHSNPTQAHQVDFPKKVPSSNEKVISSLGKAGEIMMQELGMPNGNSLSSIYPHSLPSFPSTINTSLLYHPYQLPIYIPPAPTYFANSNLSSNVQPSSLPTSRLYSDNFSNSYESAQTPNATGRKPNYSLRNDKKELSSGEPLKMEDYKPETYRSGSLRTESCPKSNIHEKYKAPRENFEIECLQTENNNYEDDLNLSDDDVLDKVISKTQNSAHGKAVTINGSVVGRNKKNDKLKQFKLAFDTVRSLSKTESPVNYSPLERNHFAQNVEVAHQKSIDDLKSMLSVEDDESFADTFAQVPDGNEGQLVGDEDVPDDFIEQNFPENHYDKRYQNDVSRNVILEEDEEEEELHPIPNRHEQWQNDNYNHQNSLENYPVGIQSTKGSNMNEYYGNNSGQESGLIITPPSMEQAIPYNKNLDENKPSRTRSSTGGRRSPSPTLKKPSHEKRRIEAFSKMSDNQRWSGEDDTNVGIADNIEKVLPSNNNNSVVNGNQSFSNHQKQSYSREFDELQAQQSNVGNYESEYYPSDKYYNSGHPPMGGYPEHEMLEDVHQEIRTAAQSDGFVENDCSEGLDQDQNVSQNNYLHTPEEYPDQYRYDEADYSNEMQGLATEQHNDYSDEQSFRDEHNHHIEFNHGQGNENSNLQHNLDNRQHYELAQGQSGEPYYPPPYENNIYCEPSQNINEPFVENYVAHSEEYQQIPSETRIYHNEPWEMNNEQEIMGQNILIANEQQNFEMTNNQLPIQGGLIVDKPIAPSNIDEEHPQLPPSKSISPVNPDSPQNSQFEEKLKPQKQTPQRSLQRRQSLLSQQSPQRQKQGQKSAQQKKQSSPKKPQSSPKKPSTPPEPQPQPHPSVMTQLIDSESESYKVEPSSQNQDDSDFDFSIGK